MYSALDIDLKPGYGFGIFEIGTSLWTLLDTLRRHPAAYPQIDIKYDPDASATTPIVVHIRPHLIFYSLNETLRRVGVAKVFGPTYPGDELRYPGIWFSFDEDILGEGLKVPHAGDRMQEVKRIIISQIEPEEKTYDALDEVTECPVMVGDLARAVVKVHDGVTLYFYPTSTSNPLHIRIGETTAQDLALDLGTPLRVHYKDDERMQIHAAAKAMEAEDGIGTGYFYNYFQYGMDFLLSETTHVVKKIILHTNVPGSPLFQRYKRCNWEIEGKPEDDEDDTPPRKRFSDRFETISHFLSPHEPPPSMSLDRTADENNLNLPNPTTHRTWYAISLYFFAHFALEVHGYNGIILEATDLSQVVSVVLF
ncbi:hypothetical protein BJ912DRAFT_940171 [Pholiota molesta]|nr:hypothetical protein BJ912DRAFT_940171 [Pholiota molesta]